MRRILIVTGIFPPEIGGPASYANALAENLASDCKVTVLTYSSNFRVAEDKARSFRVVRVWKGWPKFIRHIWYSFRLLPLVRDCDTVLALNAVTAGVPARLAAKIFKKPFIVKVVGDYAWESAMNRGRTSLLILDFQKTKKSGLISLFQRFQSWVAKKADAVIVPSEFLGRIVEGWGAPPSKIRVIYNGVEMKPSRLTKEEARKKLNISGNILLSIGRLAPWKGFRMLIKIMPKLQDINQFFKLVIVGDGPDLENLKAMVRNLGLERKVYFAGRRSREELKDFLAAADIFILNSGYEGFSHQILEAMACGVPVVTSSAGGNPEVVRQGENGFMVKYNDEFNLIEAIKTLWQSPELREHFISAGRETVGHFSFDRMIKETEKLLGI